MLEWCWICWWVCRELQMRSQKRSHFAQWSCVIVFLNWFVFHQKATLTFLMTCSWSCLLNKERIVTIMSSLEVTKKLVLFLLEISTWYGSNIEHLSWFLGVADQLETMNNFIQWIKSSLHGYMLQQLFDHRLRHFTRCEVISIAVANKKKQVIIQNNSFPFVIPRRPLISTQCLTPFYLISLGFYKQKLTEMIRLV